MSDSGNDDGFLDEYDFASMTPLPKGRFAPGRDGMRLAVLAPDIAKAFASDDELNAALRLLLRLRSMPSLSANPA